MTRLLLNLLAVARHAMRPTVGKDPTGKPAAINFYEFPPKRGRGDDDRGGPRESRPPTWVPCTHTGKADVGRAAGALMTGQCQDGLSQGPVTEQHPGVVHGGAGSIDLSWK